MTSPDHQPNDPRPVVVTGASGFLGARLVATLRDQGIDVLPLARRAGPGWTQVDDYSAAPEGDVLIHLAEDSDRRRVNDAGEASAEAARRTLGFLLEKNYRRVIYASSGVLYGDESTQPHEPGDPIHVTDIYSRIKRESELMVLKHSGGVVLRLANLYGPGMSEKNVLSAILAQVPGEGDLCVWDDAPLRDFLWIDDAAAGVAAAALGDATGIYHLGSGSGHSIREIAATVLALAGQSHRAIVATQPSGRTSHLTLTIDQTARDFGWTPKTSIKDGLQRLISPKLSSQ